MSSGIFQSLKREFANPLSIYGVIMKKNLLALALLGSVSGDWHVPRATSPFTALSIPVSSRKPVPDGRMGENINNRIGFRGSEDLGSGYKATFQLEKRFNLNDGTISGVDWEGASNLGISSPFGAVRLGRLNELPTETFRTLDPFNQFGVGSMLLSSQRSTRLSNTVRYDSPNLSGFKLGATIPWVKIPTAIPSLPVYPDEKSGCRQRRLCHIGQIR